MTHMPIKFARRVDVGSACVDICQSPKTGELVYVWFTFSYFYYPRRLYSRWRRVGRSGPLYAFYSIPFLVSFRVVYCQKFQNYAISVFI